MVKDPMWNAHVRWARERTLSALQASGAAALVATSPVNLQYLSGYKSFTHPMHLTNQAFLILTLEGKRTLVLPNGDVDFVSMVQPDADEVRTFGTFYVEPAAPGAALTVEESEIASQLDALQSPLTWAQGVLAVLEAEGLQTSELAVDQGHMMPSYWSLLQETLPAAHLQDAFPMMLRVRSVKSPFEIEQLRRSSACTEVGILASLKVAAARGTDVDIRDAFEKSVIDSGAEHLFSAIGVGTRSSLSNVQPDGTRMEPGRLLRYDVGCRYQGYSSDLARNATLGPAPDQMRRAYAAMLAGEEAGIAAMRPGVLACDIFETAMQTVRKSGVPHYRRHHVGHAIGLDSYETPILRPDSRVMLEAGMTFCVETPYYELGLGGIQVEDMVVVTRDGAERLTALSRELFELTV